MCVLGYWHFLHLANVVDKSLLNWSATGDSDGWKWVGIKHLQIISVLLEYMEQYRLPVAQKANGTEGRKNIDFQGFSW